MEEFLSKFIGIVNSKYILAYNPIFYGKFLPSLLEKIMMNFENLILYFCLFQQPTYIQDKFKEIVVLITKFKCANTNIIDYVNIFLIKHKTKFNIFYLIEILKHLGTFKQCSNFEILNYFYSCLENEINNKTIINFPKMYLVSSVKILSQNNILGNFVMIEKITKILIENNPDEIDVSDLCSLVHSLLKSGCNDQDLINILLNLIVANKKFDNIYYKSSQLISNMMERFFTEDINNLKFFNYTYNCFMNKLSELNVMNENYSNETFIEYIRNEIITSKEKIEVETLSNGDFKKYYTICKNVILHCLFKLYKNYEFTSFSSVKFSDDNEIIIDF